jgi:hypothetical protein
LVDEKFEVYEHIIGRYTFKHQSVLDGIRLVASCSLGYTLAKWEAVICYVPYEIVQWTSNKLAEHFNLGLGLFTKSIHPVYRGAVIGVFASYQFYKAFQCNTEFEEKLTVVHKYKVGLPIEPETDNDVRAESLNYFDRPLDPLTHRLFYKQKYLPGHAVRASITPGVYGKVDVRERSSWEEWTFWLYANSGWFRFHGNNDQAVPGSRHLIVHPNSEISLELTAQVMGPRAQFPDRAPAVCYSYLQMRLANCTAVNVSRFDEVIVGTSHNTVNFLYAVLLSRRQEMGLHDYDEL